LQHFNEEGIKAHVARQQTLLAVDVVDQTMVKVSTEPLLRTVAAKQFVDQILKVLGNHRTVVDAPYRSTEPRVRAAPAPHPA